VLELLPTTLKKQNDNLKEITLNCAFKRKKKKEHKMKSAECSKEIKPY